jgi:hypothetical protein
LVHFSTIPMSFGFNHWGERIWTDALPPSYIPGQLAARLPEAFLLLLGVAALYGTAASLTLMRNVIAEFRGGLAAGLQTLTVLLARRRAILVVCAAVVLPVAFLIIQRAAFYDGIRHVLFVIPMLAVVAGAGFSMILPSLRRFAGIVAIAAALYVAHVVTTLVMLHPLEYVAMNAFAGGTRGAYGRFELDYLTVAATEALRRLESRLDHDPTMRSGKAPPSVVICIPWRESMIAPMLKRSWTIETEPKKADFIIETERWRCAEGLRATLTDEVRRLDRSFARTYARRAGAT